MINQNPSFDIHLNLAGVGTQQSGCETSSEFRRRYTFLFLRTMFGISNKQLKTTADQDWASLLSQTVANSRVDYGVVLGFDKLYELHTGKVLERLNQMVVPASWVFEVCQKYKNLLPCPGLHPYRKDAIEELERLNALGATMIKWLPPAQGIDPAEPTLKDFYRKLANFNIPLLIHTGSERTFKSVDSDLGDIRRLRLPLQMGVKIIAAHSATEVIGSFKRDQINDLVQLIDEYPNLWVDNSGICNPGRFFNFPRITKIEKIVQRTVYGSDWPIPSNSFYYPRALGLKTIWNLEKIKNLIDRDLAIKEAFGYPKESIYKAKNILANLDRWIR